MRKNRGNPVSRECEGVAGHDDAGRPVRRTFDHPNAAGEIQSLKPPSCPISLGPGHASCAQTDLLSTIAIAGCGQSFAQPDL